MELIRTINQRRCASALRTLLLMAALATAQLARAVTLTLDYTYDTSGFFSLSTTNGVKARAALQSAADYFSGILDDTLSSIQTPPDFHSSTFNGVAFWSWSLNFTDPTTGLNRSLSNQVIAADEFRIYAGARTLGSSTLGVGGPGGFSWSSNNNGGGFTSPEIAQINQITADFSDDVEMRDELTGFAAWGGAVSFNNTKVWNYDHTASPAGKNDLYSVAIHELGHALGLGASSEWTALAGGSAFAGLAAKAANNGVAPPLEPLEPPNLTRSHWQSGLMSQVFGTTTAQEAAMDPEITVGTRKYFTKLDAAALTDIGWDVTAPTPTYNPADFNFDTFVNGGDLAAWRTAFGPGAGADADGDGDSDGADFLIWQRQLGATSIAAIPEPSAAALALTAAFGLFMARRRRAA